MRRRMYNSIWKGDLLLLYEHLKADKNVNGNVIIINGYLTIIVINIDYHY